MALTEAPRAAGAARFDGGQRRPRTVSDVRAQFGANALRRLGPHFESAKASYPPKEVVLLASKEEATLEVWVRSGERFSHLRTYPITRLSGGPGPKLREGDGQVPEGRYRIAGLNPNSAFHLSMKIDYPNAFDRAHARREGRVRPGGDIFIHGKDVSIGCLAMGDQAIEELFVLVADTGARNVSVLISPWDPRLRPLEVGRGIPEWMGEVYRELDREFRRFGRP